MSDIWFGDYKVHIQGVPGRVALNVYLVRYDRGSSTFIKSDGTAHTISEGERIEQDKLVFAEMSDDQLAAFAEALASKGIKTNKDSIAEGKLAATERHLEDMRLIALHKFKAPEPKG